MNKYLQLIKSEKRSHDTGSKGPEVSCESFEPIPHSRIGKITQQFGGAVPPSEPSEPTPRDHIEKPHGAAVGHQATDGEQSKFQTRDAATGSKGSKVPCEPFEPDSSECMREMHHADGALIDQESGAPFWPWGPRINPEQLATIQRELLIAVDELAKLERWRDSDYDHVVMCVERQPISTLLPDLGYFRDRLRIARAEDQARQATARRAWKFDR